MNTEEKLLLKLTALARDGCLPKSSCSRSLSVLLRPLVAAGVICEERQGSGRRLQVRDSASLRAFVRTTFPNHSTASDLPTRVAGVRRFRNSKTFPSDNPEIVQVRTWVPDALRKNAAPVGADLVTQEHGIFSFRIHSMYSLHGECAIVENPVVFGLFERLELKVNLVIYGHGRVSRRFLNWLSAQSSRDFSVLHLPDYDPIGLNEFERIQRSLGSRVRLHLPTNLADLFLLYSNPRLLKKTRSRRVLANLRSSASADIRSVVSLIDAHNAGLEQEALLPD